VAITGLVVATPGQTWTDNPTEGCSPGFWKNHPEALVTYAPNQTLDSVFTGVDPSLGGASLLDALSFKGGDTPVEKQARLLRAGVAALLNATSGIDYGVSPLGVIKAVNKRLASGDYNALTKSLDARNTLGCPLT